MQVFLVTLSPEDKVHLRDIPLWRAHFGAGIRIRNDFGLNSGENEALLRDCQRLWIADLDEQNGLVLKRDLDACPPFIQPDGASYIILKRAQEMVRDQNIL